MRKCLPASFGLIAILSSSVLSFSQSNISGPVGHDREFKVPYHGKRHSWHNGGSFSGKRAVQCFRQKYVQRWGKVVRIHRHNFKLWPLPGAHGK